MPEDFFRQGKLEMATEAFQAGPQVMLWGDCLANRIAVVALLLLMLIELADFLRTVPKIWDCVQMWRANIGLEHSISTAEQSLTQLFAILSRATLSLNQVNGSIGRSNGEVMTVPKFLR